MILVNDNLWREESQADLILVSCNAAVRRDGGLVMGRGAAQQARDRWRGIEYELGQRIVRVVDYPNPFYGVVWAAAGWAVHNRPTFDLGAFQVKYHWRDNADLDLIRRSTSKLVGILEHAGWRRVAMNFPGIGNGRLRAHDVMPVINELPDTVRVYWK